MTAERGFTADLRRRLLELIGPCPTCGQYRLNFTRQATVTGVSRFTLWRFFRGKGIAASSLDKLVDFVRAREAEKRGRA